VSEQHLNRFVNKILARPRTAREIVVFTDGAMVGAPSGDRDTQHPHFTDVGIGSFHWLYGIVGFMSSTRATVRGYGTPNFENPQKFDKFPLASSTAPFRT